jgi:hypothetical protein
MPPKIVNPAISIAISQSINLWMYARVGIASLDEAKAAFAKRYEEVRRGK